MNFGLEDSSGSGHQGKGFGASLAHSWFNPEGAYWYSILTDHLQKGRFEPPESFRTTAVHFHGKGANRIKSAFE